MPCEVAAPLAQLLDNRRQSKRPKMPIKAERASDAPVVENLAFIAERFEIQLVTYAS
jgi:hypothetical protein